MGNSLLPSSRHADCSFVLTAVVSNVDDPAMPVIFMVTPENGTQDF